MDRLSPADGIALGSLGGTLVDFLRSVVDAVADWASALEAIDLVLLAVAGTALYWIWSTLRAITRLGPIEVATLEYGGPTNNGPAPDVHVLTAALRERLGKSGLLPPPEVPAGSPQTNLIAAIAASGAPQAEWVGKLLAILPRAPSPPEFKLHGALIGSAGRGPGRGLSYWFQPKREGRVQLDTVNNQRDHITAIKHAAAEIVLGISRDAVHVFPLWSRWENTDAFVRYVDGISARMRDGDDDGEVCFEEAASHEPRNVLPRLQLANLLEKRSALPEPTRKSFEAALEAMARAGPPPENLPVSVTNGIDHMYDQAAVLGLYLDIAGERPELIAAGYRASVLAGMLATTWAKVEVALGSPPPVSHRDTAEAEIRRLVGPKRLEGELARALRGVSSAQSKAVRQRLRLYYVLLRHHRLRHRYEPRGFERRQLRRAAAISKHCLRIRELRTKNNLWNRLEIRCRRAVVRGLHLGFFGASAGWNAHYNAGCFYALLYSREVYLNGYIHD